ncbi:hypothetical protein ABIB56_002026 [Glaciihabitans sp. UYNi722]
MIRRRYLDTSTMPEGSRSIEERRPYSLAAQAHEKAVETTEH